MYEELTRIIERYRSHPDVDYALLLNGQWGCGKTYYVEHDLRRNIEATGGVLLYASLHGVRNYEEVSTHLMFARIANRANVGIRDVKDAYLACKILNVVKESGSVVGKIIQKILLHWQLKSLKKENNLDKSNVFIVIDDLERSISPSVLKNVMGSIYEDYIHNGFHVLFVCDESRIPQHFGFAECKEKYIRQTFDITQYQATLCVSYAESRFSRIPWLFECVKEYFIRFLSAKHIVNLREVSMICDGAIDVCASLDKDFAKKYGQFIFTNIAPLLHAVAEGWLTTKNQTDYAGLDDLLSVRMFYSNPEKRENLPQATLIACKFYDEYCVGLSQDYILVKSLFDFVVTGRLQSSRIEREIREIFERAATPEGEALEGLKAYRLKEEVDLSNVVAAVVRFLEEGRYSFEEIIDICVYFWTIKNDTYLSEWPYDDDLIHMFLGYIDKRAGMETEVVTSDSYTPLDIRFAHYVDTRVNTKPLLDRIKAIHNKGVECANVDRVEKMFTALFSNNRSEATRLVTPIGKRWDFFNDLFKYNKIKEVSKLPISGLNFIEYQAQENIIRISNSADFEYGQVPAIKALIGQLTNDLNDREMARSRKARILELINVLNAAIKHMDDYRAEIGFAMPAVQQTSH